MEGGDGSDWESEGEVVEKTASGGCWTVGFWTVLVLVTAWLLSFGVTMGWGAARLLLRKWGM